MWVIYGNRAVESLKNETVEQFFNLLSHQYFKDGCVDWVANVVGVQLSVNFLMRSLMAVLNLLSNLPGT